MRWVVENFECYSKDELILRMNCAQNRKHATLSKLPRFVSLILFVDFEVLSNVFTPRILYYSIRDDTMVVWCVFHLCLRVYIELIFFFKKI